MLPLQVSPGDLISGALEWLIGGALSLLGIEGLVSASLVAMVVVWLWTGYKVTLVASILRSIGRRAGEHVLVTGLIVVALGIALLATGIVPGVDLAAAQSVVGDVVGGAL